MGQDNTGLRYHPTWPGMGPTRLSPLTRDHVGHTGGLPCSGTPSRVHSQVVFLPRSHLPRLAVRKGSPGTSPVLRFSFFSSIICLPGEKVKPNLERDLNYHNLIYITLFRQELGRSPPKAGKAGETRITRQEISPCKRQKKRRTFPIMRERASR